MKIISDGTAIGTKVFMEDGSEIPFITRINLGVDINNGSYASIAVDKPMVEINIKTMSIRDSEGVWYDVTVTKRAEQGTSGYKNNEER
jgi:hypothetical protein